ncbi:hypothetical protein P7K49_036671 [Saguinus oedipus]|uniref:PPIase cyclophilin-type domain-containing protein n=1 Tax=Saguinus oedipus TaxID=9490 RepID=A0ABQ9TL17_SAGOE|nr:hypothetical protein P7K49_036671 [Saguinus oedipus]
MVNPTVFFGTAIDSEPLGCVSFELFADKIPKTAENFHALSTGEKGFGLVSPAMHGKSIYREKFDDENFILKIQFLICTTKAERLDSKHMVFGTVREGMSIVEAMECFGSRNGETSKKFSIADCGQSKSAQDFDSHQKTGSENRHKSFMRLKRTFRTAQSSTQNGPVSLSSGGCHSTLPPGQDQPGTENTRIPSATPRKSQNSQIAAEFFPKLETFRSSLSIPSMVQNTKGNMKETEIKDSCFTSQGICPRTNHMQGPSAPGENRPMQQLGRKAQMGKTDPIRNGTERRGQSLYDLLGGDRTWRERKKREVCCMQHKLGMADKKIEHVGSEGLPRHSSLSKKYLVPKKARYAKQVE